MGFRAARSHETVAVEACPVLVPALERALAEFPPPSAIDTPRGAEAPETDAEQWELSLDHTGRARLARLGGRPAPREIGIGHERLRASTGVFTQVHDTLTEVWRDHIVDRVYPTEPGEHSRPTGLRLLELFAGVGTLTLALARRASSLVAVESDASAAAHLRENLAPVAPGARILTQSVNARSLEKWLAEFVPHVVVLDPPRSGLGLRGTERLVAAPSVQRILYGACDPAPWARDLRVLVDGGFGLESVAAFDFFPQTSHVETVAVLARTAAGR